ncbi:hypothetical protein [Pokkaliibacter plantistimulans]|nr:hypothetical protein [Pokkaliibacter plantistimulans]
MPEVKEIIIKTSENSFSISKDVLRRDVTNFFKKKGINFINEKHGFQEFINPEWMEIYAKKGSGEIVKCATMYIEEIKTIDVGVGDWLYLDAANRSRDQAAGKLDLSLAAKVWNLYFRDMQSYLDSKNISWCFVIAPGKELVLPEYAPYPVVENNSFRGFFNKFDLKNKIICPIDELKLYGIFSYWHGESHWNDIGAAIACKKVLDYLNVENDLNPLEGISIAGPAQGDLGKKLSFYKSRPSLVIKQKYKFNKNFDNEIGNTGRLIIYTSNEIFAKGVLLVVGDSFSHWMLKFLAPFFEKTIFFHGVARADKEFIASTGATHVIFQNNSRFLHSYPENEQYLEKFLKEKATLLGRESSGIEFYEEVKNRVMNEYV